MEIDATTLLSYPVLVPIDPRDPCAVKLEDIEVKIPVRVVWILPPGFHFRAKGVDGLTAPDFRDGRFDGTSRRRYRWTAPKATKRDWQYYTLSFEWINDDGELQSCVVPDLRIINRS